ncbi:MAG: hypothetical protein DRR42_14060 [Gammaproteobacteria bacterium]|nr:MAG: hypothetical protein DRR42_14060 [Gammaproteobacteria bacterium]
MRAIDSALTLCRKNNRNLTVLWVKEPTLNCSFKELFLIPENENFELIEYTNKLPVPCLKKINKVKAQNTKVNAVVENRELNKIYNSKEHVDTLTISEMDSIFYANVKELINPIFDETKTHSYISSCYRLCKIEDNYSSFAPTLDINEKVKNTVNNYNNTIGIHIRRSDHRTSIRYSPTSKFVKAIEDTLKDNYNASFFLSTDDKEAKENLLNKFGSKIIVNDIKSYDRSDASAIKDALTDLFCLSRTKKIYGSHHSTFSQLASDIGGIKEITIK